MCVPHIHRHMDTHTQTCMHTYVQTHRPIGTHIQTHKHTCAHIYINTQATGAVLCPTPIWPCLAPSRVLDAVFLLDPHTGQLLFTCCPPSPVGHDLASSHMQLLSFPQALSSCSSAHATHAPPHSLRHRTRSCGHAVRAWSSLGRQPSGSQAPRELPLTLLGLEAPKAGTVSCSPFVSNPDTRWSHRWLLGSKGLA